MALQCPRCKYIDDRMDVNFCQRCKTPMSNTGRQLQRRTASSLPAVVNRSGLILHSQPMDLAVNSDLKKLYVNLYESIEALKRGNPFWELVGKDLTAYRIERLLEQKFEELAELRSKAFLRMHEQLLEAELARQRGHYEAVLLRDRLQRQINIAADALDQINQVFSQERFSTLPEEAKIEFLSDLYQRAMDQVFTLSSQSMNIAALSDKSARRPTIIIDPDEF